MNLILKDAGHEWDGTGYVALKCDLKIAENLGIGKHIQNLDPYILLKTDYSSTGARLKYMEPGEGIIIIDRYLRRDIGLDEGQKVEVKPFEPSLSTEVVLKVPEKFIETSGHKDLIYTYLHSQTLIKGQKKSVYLYSGEEVIVVVEEVKPHDNSILNDNTKLNILKTKETSQNVFFRDIGGLDNEIKFIRERLELPLKKSNQLANLGIHPPKGVLLTGPPGTGKTLIARALSNEVGANFFSISGPEIFSPFYGDSEKKIRNIFSQAKKDAPSVILIDEIDSIAPKRQSLQGELEKRVVASLLTEMDGLSEIKDVIVLGTTNEPNLLDQALRRPGRFDYEVLIGIPDEIGRRKILDVHTRKIIVENRDKTLQTVAAWTHGFTGADLMLICREAVYNSLQRNNENKLPSNHSDVNLDDFEKSRNRVKPTGMREFIVELPTSLQWSYVGGLCNVKKTIQDEVIKSITHAKDFERMGIQPIRGVLLYGPPGTGKTLLVKTLAREAEVNFISVRGPEIFSKWFGESEAKIREIFGKAREISPCIIFFDEIDAITSKRDSNQYNLGNSIVNQILTEMDGITSTKGVYVMAATGHKELLDPALLRPGRFDYQIEVPLPGKNERKEIFIIHLENKKVSKKINLEKLSTMTDGFSGAHIAEVCRRAGITALKETNFDGDFAEIKMSHLVQGVETIKSTIEKLEKSVTGVEVV